jgi:hypothetical protein
MKCPSCGLLNPESARICDCGYDFETPVCAENKLVVSSTRTAARVRIIRSVARCSAALGILVCVFVLLGFIFEGGRSPHKPLPFVLNGSPFGTYAQSTQLGLLTLGAGIVLSFAGAILAFWWERAAAGILIAGSVLQTFLWGMWLLHRAMPARSLWSQLITFIVPPFLTAILLLVISRTPNKIGESASGEDRSK